MASARTLALGVSLACLASVAQAQTVITRQIADEPVETTVTQGPNGTVVTRRPLGPAASAVATRPYGPAAAPMYAAPGVYAPAVTETVVEAADEPIDATIVRQTVNRIPAQAPRRAATARSTPRTAAARRAPVVAQDDTVRRTSVRRAASPRPALTPAERRIVYRTIVEEQVVRPVVTREVVTAPYYGWNDWNTPRTWSAPVVAADDDVEPVAPVVSRTVYTVGSVLPTSVPLYGVPQSAALRVPAAQRYSYAYLGGRVYLVDPATGLIVADVTQ